MNKIVYLAVFFLLVFFVAGCSDKDEEGEPISGLIVKIYADYQEAFDNTDQPDYAYWDMEPFKENTKAIVIELGSRSEFGIIRNLSDDIHSWFENGFPVTVRIDGVIKPSSVGYLLVHIPKSIDLYVSDIYKID